MVSRGRKCMWQKVNRKPADSGIRLPVVAAWSDPRIYRRDGYRGAMSPGAQEDAYIGTFLLTREKSCSALS